MTPAVIIALTPLWFGLVGAVFVFTFGRRIAQRERQTRLQLEKEQEQQTALEAEQTALFRYTNAVWYPIYSGAGIYYLAGHHGLQSQQSYVVRGNQITAESTKAEQQTDLETKAPLALVA